MLMPSIFRENLLDQFFNDPFRGFDREMNKMMKTDIKEGDQGYELIMDMPGISKENIKAELKDGYLTISASNQSNEEEKDENGRYIRRERCSGYSSRSFYVGDAVTQEDIKAKFENGTLKLQIPKKEAKPEVEEKKYIAIEG